MRLDYAIVFVSDMPRAVVFYRDVLGLTLRFETSHWTEFETGPATLALHLANTAAGARGSHDSAGHARPGLSVPNLDAFHARMLANQARCVQEPREVSGARIAAYSDPDGLIISVSERRPARPV